MSHSPRTARALHHVTIALAAILCTSSGSGLGGCSGSSDHPFHDGGGNPPPDDGGGGGPSATCDQWAVVSGDPELRLEQVATGLSSPLLVTAPPGDLHRIFVVQQGGRIRVVRDGTLLETPFLDIADRLSSGGERGLLGLAFHPDYASNGRFFVNYTNLAGNTHIAEYGVTADADVADPATERVLLEVDQPFANHNGGNLIFGPDGLLYIGLGDGGLAADPFGNGQRLDTLLGKILRIDVDGERPYGIPADNPFVGQRDARGEIFTFGLRNPWRFNFNRANGDLYIGDVGQNAHEEIDATPAGQIAGRNYGWNKMEGNFCFSPSSGCDQTGLTLPVVDYPHSDGCAVTGGFVYQGRRMPGLQGTYFYSDSCSGFVRSFRLRDGRAEDARDWTSALGTGGASIASFGEDACGELYIADLGSGQVHRLAPKD